MDQVNYILSRIDDLKTGQALNNRILRALVENQDRNHQAVIRVERLLSKLSQKKSDAPGSTKFSLPQISVEQFMKTVITTSQWVLALAILAYILRGGNPADLHLLGGLK
jgi:hypothetical protein